MDWINEIDLGQISEKFPFYDDYDIFQLGMYGSRSLTKIAKIAEKEENAEEKLITEYYLEDLTLFRLDIALP